MFKVCSEIYFHWLWNSKSKDCWWADAMGCRFDNSGIIYIDIKKVFRLLKNAKKEKILVNLEKMITYLITHEYIHGIIQRDVGAKASAEWDYYDGFIECEIEIKRMDG